MISVHRHFDHRSEPVEQQSKNFFPLALVPAATLSGVMEDGAGGAAFEAAPGLMIQFMRHDFSRPGDFIRPLPLACRQGRFEVADAFFHAAIVAGIVWRIHQCRGCAPGRGSVAAGADKTPPSLVALIFWDRALATRADHAAAVAASA